MPNWCMNTMEIEGTPEQIQQVKQAVEADRLFDTLYPIPQELKDTTADGSERPELVAKYGYSDWYGWCTANWGTKWDASDLSIMDEGDGFDDSTKTIRLGFSTAWAPAIGFYEHLYEQMNVDCEDLGDPVFRIRATYYEPGCDFAGVWENGDDRCYTVSSEDDDFFLGDEDGELLDAEYGIIEAREEYRAEEMEEVQTWYEDGKKELDLA